MNSHPFVKTLGSIKLAVPLLAIISVILVGATFWESEVGSSVVQQTIYKSSWFGALMFLLALNLAVSTLSRYPWKGARRLGFAMTHWGLVVIIAGSAAVIHLSTEGMLLARTDGGPVNTLRVEGDLVEYASPGNTPQQTDIFIKSDGSIVPNKLGQLSLLGYSNNTMTTVRFENDGEVANPAVKLRLKSDRMNQTLERWLAVAPAAYDQIDIGPAALQIVQAEDAQDFKQATTEPAQASVARKGTLDFTWQGSVYSLDVAEALADAPAMFNQASASPLSVQVTGYWPDFRLDGNRQPVSASDQPRNPAVQVVFKTEETTETWFIFSRAGFEPIRTSAESAQASVNAVNETEVATLPVSAEYQMNAQAGPSAFFRVVIASDGQLYYAANASSGFQTGSLAVGQSIQPGWADFTVTLDSYLPTARVVREIQPIPKDAPESGSPALLVAVGDRAPQWVAWGTPTQIETADGSAYVAFAPKQLQLPFSLKLNDFIVERNEGSESVAMWTSDIALIDSHRQELSNRRVWMNHPTWFHGWKIAQASWNPGDLAQSTLQVKREPWWVTGLTWLGSAMVSIGIGIMFYGRAITKKVRVLSKYLDLPDSEDAPTEENQPGTIPLFNAFLGRS